ncbi:competence protein ComEC [Albidovulum inexpectatum]|uniref:Competence protein ComEC n=1 Tax=Albidovulum inexpectatum TaxID=196587 RepID=A0A2S5JJS9_9RHOB|nr:ComEC/Rec2 family competence protein [Albidovulum inexpectatum]PPB81693.1 competence protein ComEC [Albidovulum inexpectatum]
MRLRHGLIDALGAARARIVLWAPVLIGCGIGAYFSLPREPGLAEIILMAATVLIGGTIGLFGPWTIQAPALWLALIGAGVLLADLRANLVAAPVLPHRYYGPVEGRIVDIGRSSTDLLRLTLGDVVLQGLDRRETPHRVRVTLHGDQPHLRPEPGMVVILTAHLSPPNGPVEPGGFDFRRLAWFQSLGAVGYTRTPVLALARPEGAAQWPGRLRHWIAQSIRARISGQPGALAAALLSGDRSGLDRHSISVLRAANLSHLIAISGLHMGLLTGFVFAACRYGMALLPALALRIETRKAAAIVALAAGAFYLMLAGPSVATRRAFVMVAVMLLAVLADRRAVSLNSVALAALIILTLEPESLLGPGFQMSFAATVALIVTYQAWLRLRDRVPGLVRPVALLALSSLAAGLATAPISAAQFNRLAEYGLLANILAVPLMGAIVMPAGVIAAVLAPVGLAEPALWVMGQGTALILVIADWVAGLDGAVRPVMAPPDFVLPLLAASALSLVLTQAHILRIAAALGIAFGFASWAIAERPVILVAPDAALVGVMGPEGRVLSRARGAGFAAQNWLQNDGDLADQAQAAERAGFDGFKGERRAQIMGRAIVHLGGKGTKDRVGPNCIDGAIIVLAADWNESTPANCLLIDRSMLRRTGSLALHPSHHGVEIVAANAIAGHRPWTSYADKAGRQ